MNRVLVIQVSYPDNLRYRREVKKCSKNIEGKFYKILQVFTASQVSYFNFIIRNILYCGKYKTTEVGKGILFQFSYFYSSSSMILTFIAEKFQY